MTIMEDDEIILVLAEHAVVAGSRFGNRIRMVPREEKRLAESNLLFKEIDHGHVSSRLDVVDFFVSPHWD